MKRENYTQTVNDISSKIKLIQHAQWCRDVMLLNSKEANKRGHRKPGYSLVVKYWKRRYWDTMAKAAGLPGVRVK